MLLPSLIDTAADGKELSQRVAEAYGVEIALPCRHQFDAIGDFLGLANQVREASLPSFWVGRIVCGIAVGNEVSGKGAAEDRDGDV